MSDMSFKQAKELVERLELAEVTIRETLKKVAVASVNFNQGLLKQEEVLQYIPKSDERLNIMKIVVAVNIGFIIGILSAKYLL